MRCPIAFTTAVVAVCAAVATPARAQSHEVQIGGFGLFGNMQFTATKSFDAILGHSSAPLIGGGATIGLPWGGVFVDVGGWRVKQDGQRVFLSQGTVFKLGIPVSVTITPIEITGGWRFRNLVGRLTPYVGAGLSSFSYKETSKFANADEDVSERFTGFHLVGGGQYRIVTWLGIGGEVAWTSVANAIGEGGVSRAFTEDNLGGTSLRARITLGR